MKIQEFENKNNDERGFSVTASRAELAALGPTIVEGAIKIAVERIAAMIVEEHGQEIIAKVSAKAIANLALVQAAAETRDLLNRKPADR